MKTDINRASLAELSILRNRVSEAEKAYYLADLGYSYRQREELRLARNHYSEKCVEFVEKLLDTERKECENVSVETKILLEKVK